jgi:hypothetical protein
LGGHRGTNYVPDGHHHDADGRSTGGRLMTDLDGRCDPNTDVPDDHLTDGLDGHCDQNTDALDGHCDLNTDELDDQNHLDLGDQKNLMSAQGVSHPGVKIVMSEDFRGHLSVQTMDGTMNYVQAWLLLKTLGKVTAI